MKPFSFHTTIVPAAVLILGSVPSEHAQAEPIQLGGSGFNIVATCNAGTLAAASAQQAPDAAMRQAIAAQAANAASLMATPGVVGTGVGRNPTTGEPTLEIYVESEAAAASLALPSAVQGVPTRVIVTGKVRAF